MALTLANAITEVRYVLNEASAAYWTDAEITAWIKEGTRIFSSKTLMVEDTQTLTMVASQLRYTSSDESWIANMIEPYAAIYDNGSSKYKGLIKVHPRQLGNVATFAAGEPKYYTMHDRSIYIWPLPSSAVAAAGSMSFLFSTETDDITDLTDEYQHLPIIYACSKAKQKDQKWAESNTLLMQFYNETNFERSDKHNRETDTYDMFKIKSGGGGRVNAPTG
jgi:hypothetical protein